MALINIGGVDLPTPSNYQVNIQDIDKAERNAKGGLIKERIRSGVRKIELEWKYLTRSQMSTLLGLVGGSYFTVQYLDPESDSMQTRTFYAGDRPVPMLDYKNGVPRYRDIKFNIIEK